MKSIVFDAGTLITLSMNGLLDMLKDLKKIFNGKFLITREIKSEIVDRPLAIKKYKLGALRLKALIDEGILEFPQDVGINDKDITDLTYKLLKESNTLFYANGNYDKPIHIIDLGEASILALSSLLSQKGIENIIAIDERTTRILCEKPENLKEILESKLHIKITQKGRISNLNYKTPFIRSTELIYVAYKKGLIKNSNPEVLDAMLYGAKFKGAAITSEEIKQIEKL